MRRTACAVLLMALALTTSAPAYAAIEPLPTGTDVDYQLGGAATPADHVGIVVRDRNASPAAGRYNVCYVNGFQTQPDERGFWERRMHLVLHDGDRPVVDEAWGEWLLDIRTPAKRARLATIVARWSRGCAADGFDAVEFDNLDSFTRSHGLIKRDHALAYARLLANGARSNRLAPGQKNLAGFNGHKVGFEFAVAEECGRYDECDTYVKHFGRQVVIIEYRAQDFRATCRDYGSTHAVVLRDRDLTPGGVHRWC